MPAINFPNSPSLNDYFESNGKAWTYNGTSWDIVQTPANLSIASGSISATELASNSVTTVKINSGAVTTAKIAASAVTATELGTDSVTTDKIAAGAVTAAKLGNDISLTPADGSITQAKLASTLSGITICTSSTKPGSPFTGQVILETDTEKLKVWDGSTWIFIGRAPADPPTSITVVPASTDAAVSFTAGDDNGSPITNYQYALSTNGGSTYGSYSALSPADATSPITISGLSAITTYNVKLKAVNSIGVGVESSAASFTTAALGEYESITTYTVGAGGQSTITFSAIPATFKHLQIRFMAQSNRSTYVDNLEMYVNSDQGANYSVHYFIGDGANTPSSTGAANSTGFLSTTQNLGSSSGTPNVFGVGVIDILDYANTTKYKTVRGLWGLNLNAADASGSYGRLGLSSGNWRNTNAISSITFYPTLGTSFTQYTSFALYGIRG